MSGVIALVALAAMALVGLDLALRPQRHVRASADRVEGGSAMPLEGLSHRLLPQFETARAYRLIGIGIVAAAAVLAWVIAR
jgi:hypothetical protein